MFYYFLGFTFNILNHSTFIFICLWCAIKKKWLVSGRAPFLVIENLQRLVFTPKLVAGPGVDPRSPSSATGSQTGCWENPLECSTKMQSPGPCPQRFQFGSWGQGMGIFIKFNIRVMQILGVCGPHSWKHCSRPYYFHKTPRYSLIPAPPHLREWR